MIVAVYKNSKNTVVNKEDLNSIFTLPGEYFVFQFNPKSYAYQSKHKDPYTYFSSENETKVFQLGNFQLIDTTLTYFNKDHTQIKFTIFNHYDKTTGSVNIDFDNSRIDLYTEGVLFLVKTMISLSNNNSWDELKKIEEFETLKKQVKQLQNEVRELKQQISSPS